jgi:PAS domain S-box-containing protein
MSQGNIENERLKSENEQLREEIHALRKKERQLREIERTMRIISSRFVGTFDMDEIDASLADLGKLSGASRAYLFLLSGDSQLMSNTHEWCAQGVRPEIDNLQRLPTTIFPWWKDKLQKGETIHIKNVSDMPKEARTEREILEKQDIKSLLVLPVYTGNRLKGFIGFDNVYKTGDWSVEDFRLLQTSSDIIGNAIEHKKLEDLMRESEGRFRKIYENMSVGLAHVSLDFRILSANTAYCRMLGYTEAELVGKHLKDLTHPDLVEENLKKQNRLASGEIDHYRMEKLFIHKNGHTVHGMLDANLIRTRDGNPSYFLGSVIDITDLRQAEEAQREFDRKIGTLMRNLPGMAYKCVNLRDWPMQYVSDGCSPLTGYRPDELVDNRIISYGSLIHPDDRDKVWKEVQKRIEAGKHFELEYRILTKDQKEKWVWERGLCISYDQDEKGIIEGFISDITHKVNRELELLKKHHAIENAIAGVVFMDMEGIIEYINPELLRVLSFKKQEVLGKHIREFIRQENLPEEVLDEIKETGSWRGEMTVRDKYDRDFEVLCNASVIKDNDNQPIGLQGTVINITERKKFEQELVKAKEKAEESDRLKSAFLANMSHEIRTPLNAIMGFAQLLKEEKIPVKKQEYYFDTILSQSHFLLQLINDIIDLSKINANQIRLEKSTFSLNEFLADLHQELMVKMGHDESKQHLTLTLNKGLKDHQSYIYTDLIRLEQIFTNLLSNAVKFTEKGEIEFGYRKRSQDNLLFYVRDTGIGVPENKRDKIFKRFAQADESVTRKYGGTGLGLSISKALTELMGGQIWLDSETNKGSVFYFTLPLQLQHYPVREKTTATFKEQHSWESKAILLVEDDLSSRDLIKEFLNSTGVNLFICETGKEALNVFMKNPDIDLILMDIKLPDINGWELTRKIRLYENNKRVPIIAQTAYAMSEDAQKCMDAGCDDYISKPIDSLGLLQKIGKFI